MSRVERAHEALRAAIGAVGAAGGHRIWVPAFDRLDPDAFARADGTPSDGDEANLAAWLRDAAALIDRCAWAGIPVPAALSARARAGSSYLWIRGAPGVNGTIAQLAREDAAIRGIADVVLAVSDWRVWRFELGGISVFRRTDDRGSARVVVCGAWNGPEVALDEHVVLAPVDRMGSGALTVARVDVSTGRGPRIGHAHVGDLGVELRLGTITLERPGGVRLRVGPGCVATVRGPAVDIRCDERAAHLDPAHLVGGVVDGGDRVAIAV